MSESHWSWDPARRSYYLYRADEQVYVYQDGTRVDSAGRTIDAPTTVDATRVEAPETVQNAIELSGTYGNMFSNLENLSPQQDGLDTSLGFDRLNLDEDIVDGFKLETTMEKEITKHKIIDSRGDKVTEEWKREHKEPIGSGGFGEVYLEKCVRGPRKGQQRAVKVIQKENLKDDNAKHNENAQSGVDFRREIFALAKFSEDEFEDHFVKAHGWWKSKKGDIFIAMDYFPNGDLGKLLKKKKRLSESKTRAIISQVLNGLCIMHENRFVHRDLKAENLLIYNKKPELEVKISDFGFAKSTRVGSPKTTLGGHDNTAPEVLGLVSRNEHTGSYTSACDIWSLGILTSRMLTGSTPFQDLPHLIRFCKERRKLPRELQQKYKLSEEAFDFIRACLLVSAEDRSTAAELLHHPWLCESDSEDSDSS